MLLVHVVKCETASTLTATHRLPLTGYLHLPNALQCTKMQRPAAMLAASKERFAARVPLMCTIVVLSVVCVYQPHSYKCAQQKRRGRAIA